MDFYVTFLGLYNVPNPFLLQEDPLSKSGKKVQKKRELDRYKSRRYKGLLDFEGLAL